MSFICHGTDLFSFSMPQDAVAGDGCAGGGSSGGCSRWLLEALVEGGACYLWEPSTGRVFSDPPEGQWPRPVGEWTLVWHTPGRCIRLVFTGPAEACTGLARCAVCKTLYDKVALAIAPACSHISWIVLLQVCTETLFVTVATCMCLYLSCRSEACRWCSRPAPGCKGPPGWCVQGLGRPPAGWQHQQPHWKHARQQLRWAGGSQQQPVRSWAGPV